MLCYLFNISPIEVFRWHSLNHFTANKFAGCNSGVWADCFQNGLSSWSLYIVFCCACVDSVMENCNNLQSFVIFPHFHCRAPGTFSRHTACEANGGTGTFHEMMAIGIAIFSPVKTELGYARQTSLASSYSPYSRKTFTTAGNPFSPRSPIFGTCHYIL